MAETPKTPKWDPYFKTKLFDDMLWKPDSHLSQPRSSDKPCEQKLVEEEKK